MRSIDWGQGIRTGHEFVYFGGIISRDERCDNDIKRRIGLTATTFGGQNKIWRDENIRAKVKMYKWMVVAVLLLYVAEC